MQKLRARQRENLNPPLLREVGGGGYLVGGHAFELDVRGEKQRESEEKHGGRHQGIRR